MQKQQIVQIRLHMAGIVNKINDKILPGLGTLTESNFFAQEQINRIVIRGQNFAQRL
jgi:hypothetical protein